MKSFKLAFTLSEVLIVVAIIGTIATLAIPNLSNDINEEKYATLLRSTVSQLDASYGKLISEYGSSENAAATKKDCNNETNQNLCFGDILISYLNVKLNCRGTKDGRCFSTDPLYEVDGTVAEERDNSSDGCGYMFLLSNGVGVCWRSFSTRDYIDIDLDGPKKGPNKRGVDNFKLDTFSDAVLPAVSTNNRDKTINGEFNIDEYDSYGDWLYSIGNMDYLKCPDDLNWINKHSCE